MADKIIYLRMLVYTLTIGIHISNIIYMTKTSTSVNIDMDDPEIPIFRDLQARFFTCWTFFLQIVHAFAGLTFDSLTLMNDGDKNFTLSKYLRGFRNTLFSAIIWPSTWIVSTIFWSLYHYDRTLVYPEFADKLLTSTSNHIMHTLIVPISIMEILLQPRSEPRSHTRNVGHLIFHLLLYFLVLFYTYMERKIWIYRFFAVFYETNYFLVLPLGILSFALLMYYIQWPLTSLLWSNKIKEKKQR